MTIDEIKKLLIYVQAFDNRTVEREHLLAWNDALGEYPFNNAHEAVRRFFATEKGWIMPGDVHRLMRQVRADRERDQQRQSAIEAKPSAPAPTYQQLRQSIKDKYREQYEAGIIAGNADRAYNTTMRETGGNQHKARAASQQIRATS